MTEEVREMSTDETVGSVVQRIDMRQHRRTDDGRVDPAAQKQIRVRG